jgi:pimeloyl-ACP methyl ester carboxylesterase
MTDRIEPFEIHVDYAVLRDLHARLLNTRWPAALDDPDWAYGIEQTYVRELVRYWLEQYDWRQHEKRLNAWPQYRTEIDGHSIHFYHVRSALPGATPLILTHGWPGSVVEFVDLIGPLTDPLAYGADAQDAFHVVVPSLPGYGFSQPNNAKGWEPKRTARAWAELMARLGYTRYGAQGGDWGYFVSQWVARQDPAHCFAIHVNLLFATPPSQQALDALPALPALDRDRWARFQHYTAGEGGYASIQASKPETLGLGLADSPVAQLGWIAEKFRSWTDCDGVIENAVARDDLLTNVMLYWITNTGASSARFYYEGMRSGAMFPQPTRLETPVGHAAFPKEIIAAPRSWCEAAFNVVHWTDMPRGGHFAALEQPELLLEDVRAFFRRFRETR